MVSVATDGVVTVRSSALSEQFYTIDTYGQFSTDYLDEDWKEDEDYIANLLKAQGYWAGGKVKYFFDEDFVLIRKEERKFGE